MLLSPAVNTAPRTPADHKFPADSSLPEQLPHRESTEISLNTSFFSSSEIGAAVRNALNYARQETLPARYCDTTGKVTRIVTNDSDRHDESIDNAIERIKTATNEICIQTYIFSCRDEAGRAILSALAERQNEIPDLKVFIAVNEMPYALSSITDAVKEFGLKAAVAVHPKSLGRASLHSKAIIIDGHTAIVGGNNIDNPDETDVTVELKGPVVESLLAEFDHAFYNARYHYGVEKLPSLDLLTSHARNPPDTECSADAVPMQILGKEGRSWFGPFDGMAANEALLAAINTAEREVCVISPNFNSLEVWDKLCGAARRDVRINILIPHDYINIPSFIDAFPNRSLKVMWDRLDPDLKKNISIRWYSEDGKHYGKIHSKYISVDGKWAYVGSQNMDNQSWNYSRELGVGIDDRKTVGNLNQLVFYQNWETSIELKPSFLSYFLPLPARNFIHRCARFLVPPLAAIERAADLLYQKLFSGASSV